MLRVWWSVPATCLQFPFLSPGHPMGRKEACKKNCYLWLQCSCNEHLHEGIYTITHTRSKPGPLMGKSHC